MFNFSGEWAHSIFVVSYVDVFSRNSTRCGCWLRDFPDSEEFLTDN